MNDKLIHIRQLIDTAKKRDSASTQLSHLLALRTNQLHKAINLPTDEAEK